MNIALIDDHQILAELLQVSLTSTFARSDVRSFNTGSSFLKCNLDEWKPDIIISDLIMAEIDGFDLIQITKPMLKKTSGFIFLSSATDPGLVQKALTKGAKGFLSKKASMNELTTAIENVFHGRQYIEDSVKESLLNYTLSGEKPLDSELSLREKEVLHKICSGKTPKEIAFELQLSLNTVQFYNNSILRKFNLNRTIDLVSFVISKGLYK